MNWRQMREYYENVIGAFDDMLDDFDHSDPVGFMQEWARNLASDAQADGHTFTVADVELLLHVVYSERLRDAARDAEARVAAWTANPHRRRDYA